MPFLAEHRHPETGCALVIDDDGRVAWAYLHAPEGDIIGDVWLYNRLPTPALADWSNPLLAPFLNAASHARALDQPPPTDATELEVDWTVDGELLLADVHLRGVLLARLSPGCSPGCRSTTDDASEQRHQPPGEAEVAQRPEALGHLLEGQRLDRGLHLARQQQREAGETTDSVEHGAISLAG